MFPGKSKAILKPIPPEQNRTAAEPVLGGGTVHVFKVELANCNAEAAEKLWEGKPEWFRNHPGIQKLYNNKIKEKEDKISSKPGYICDSSVLPGLVIHTYPPRINCDEEPKPDWLKEEPKKKW